MLGIGYLVGRLLSWSIMDSLFLGGILSISSTTIIVRAFDELGLKGRSFVSLVFGVLIIEDLIAILLLVLLSSVAAAEFGLASLVLTNQDQFINKPIRECGLREAVNGLIVGIEREGQRYLSPDSSMKLMPGDLIWLVGDKDLIKGLRS